MNLCFDTKCMRCEGLIRRRLPLKFADKSQEEVDKSLMNNQLGRDRCPYCGIETFQIVVTPTYVPLLVKKPNG